jgi:hypothetical protein
MDDDRDGCPAHFPAHVLRLLAISRTYLGLPDQVRSGAGGAAADGRRPLRRAASATRETPLPRTPLES